jgi:hypothetical protein
VTVATTQTLFDHALKKAIDTPGATGAAVYLKDPERAVLLLAAALGQCAANGAPWPGEIAWANGAAAAEPLTAVETDQTTLTVPLLLGEDEIGAVVVSARARVLILTAFPAMGRRIGREPLGSRSALVPRDADIEVPLRAWRLDDAGRVALLCAFTGDAEALARELYFTGDLRERCGALRGLAVLGRTPGAIDTVRDAVRSSAVDLFEAALADNPYACRFLPDDEFRHAVLKAAFVGVSIARLPGVEARADGELSRMLLSYVTEREVAGRSVPPDIWPVAALHPTPGLAGKLCGYLEHPSEAHRAAAAQGLGRIGDRRTHPFLNDRLAREDDRTVRRLLERALA